LVEVAEVVVAMVAVKLCKVVEPSASKVLKVVEAVETKPLRKAKVVEVAFSPVPSVVQGKAKLPPPPQPVQDPTIRLPRMAEFARKFVVEASPET